MKITKNSLLLCLVILASTTSIKGINHENNNLKLFSLSMPLELKISSNLMISMNKESGSMNLFNTKDLKGDINDDLKIFFYHNSLDNQQRMENLHLSIASDQSNEFFYKTATILAVCVLGFTGIEYLSAPMGEINWTHVAGLSAGMTFLTLILGF